MTNFRLLYLNDFASDNINEYDLLDSVIMLQRKPPDCISLAVDQCCKSLADGDVGLIRVPYRVNNGCRDADIMQMHFLEQNEFLGICRRNNFKAQEIDDLFLNAGKI